jgi:hypothetical protein
VFGKPAGELVLVDTDRRPSAAQLKSGDHALFDLAFDGATGYTEAFSYLIDCEEATLYVNERHTNEFSVCTRTPTPERKGIFAITQDDQGALVVLLVEVKGSGRPVLLVD